MQQLNPLQQMAIRELRGGGYTQITDRLTDGAGGFCCLGVFCDVFQEDAGLTKACDEHGIPGYGDEDGFVFTCTLPNRVHTLLHLNDEVGIVKVSGLTATVDFVSNEGVSYGSFESLAAANDNCVPFRVIADMLEAHPEYFFHTSKENVGTVTDALLKDER